jgi:UPF0755 protein
MSKFIIFLLIFGIIAGVGGYFGYQFYYQFYGVAADSPTGNYSFEVKSGNTLKDVAKILEADKVIPSGDAFLTLASYRGSKGLQIGKYTLILNKDKPEMVLQKIDEETDRITAEIIDATKRPVVTITFKEGEPLDEIMYKMDINGVAKYEDLAAFALVPENFDKVKFPFLPEKLDCVYGDIKTCAKYYPEGYMYPDTYQFFVDSTPKEAFEKMLTNFNTKVWKNLSTMVGNKNFQDVIIMASVMEKETGRPAKGVSSTNRDEVNIERRNMAQVFYNRTAVNMKWQSDVTAEYGQFSIQTQADGKKVFVKRKLCQQTFTVENCLYLDSPEIATKYNAYQVNIPIAPVTNPQYDNIYAALNPIDNDYIYFVSDVSGKKYFSTTEAEFNQSIVNVQKINRELENSN